ncbi:MAG: hypothetical protein R8J94_13760 [Acidimicrobiia bacterium]|nr:hypothetical protein [Acidimicrobiia bacterium]
MVADWAIVPTELLLTAGTQTWTDVSSALTRATSDLLAGELTSFTIARPQSGQRIDANRLNDGSIRLAASGNDSLVGGNRLTVRDERAVIAVGFSVASASWGTFYWDWTAPVAPDLVASGIIRTMRDIYKSAPADLELSVTL